MAVIVPNVGQIIAGEDHAGAAAIASGIQAVSATGVQPDQAVASLTPERCFFHLIQRDVSGNISTRVATTGVTVAGSDGVSAQINILNRSQHQLAPEAISMDISVDGFEVQGPVSGAVYNPQYHELYYFWDFGEDYTFSAPENLIDAHKNSGVGYGPKVSHTYRTPGTYTVSCLVVEPSSARSTTAVLDVTIADPETAFSGLNTVFVSPSSDFSNEPSGARRARSLAEAFDLIVDTNTGPKRIILNRGEIFPYSGGWFGLNGGTSVPSVHVVASNNGSAKPRVEMSGGIAWNDLSSAGNGADKDFIWQNIDIVGSWDSVTETGEQHLFFTDYDWSPRLALFDSCSFDGFNSPLSFVDIGTRIQHRFAVVNDCSITNWRSYGIWYSVGVGLALTGTKIVCDPQASVGGPKDGFHNAQGPLRVNSGDNLIVSNCDVFNRIGWAPVGEWYTAQPCIRQNVIGNPGYFSSIQTSSFEGGAEIVGYTVEGGQSPAPINGLLEKCYLLATHQTWSSVRCQMAGLTMRNNVVIFPNAGRDATFIDPPAFMEMVYEKGGIPETYSAPVRVYNNSYVNLMKVDDYADGPYPIQEVSIPAPFTDVISDNHLVYQPNVGVTADGPLETSPILWIPREAGYRTNEQPFMPSTASSPETIASFIPQAGSDALGDAINGQVAYDDFFGTRRPQYASRGAFENS